MFSSDPNQPVQNYEIVNPTLEQQVADLLPSVAGYGGNLRSTNTIIPIVDLTSAAEGTTLPESLQQAIAFGSMTAFNVSNATSTIISNTGFYRVFGVVHVNYASAAGNFAGFDMSDGISTKRVWGSDYGNGFNDAATGLSFDFIVYLGSGETLSAVSTDANSHFYGSTRQVATADGTLVDPSGFPV